jgi:hypothetical protein
MQLMQVTYSLGSAAEDIFKAYIYYAVPCEDFQKATSYINASGLISSVLAGILGTILGLELGFGLGLGTELFWVVSLP